MRIFWYNGGLQVVPDSDQEAQLLCKLADNLKIRKPPEMQNCIPRGETPSGDGLFELIVGDEKPSPRSSPRKLNHKQKVFCIDKLL